MKLKILLATLLLISQGTAFAQTGTEAVDDVQKLSAIGV